MSRPLTDLFPVGPETRLDPEFFTGLIREVETRIADLQVLKQGLEAAITQAQEIALARVNDIIGPAQDELAQKLVDAQSALEAAETLLADLGDDQFAIAQIAGLQDALDGKAASSHSHSISNVGGLQDALNSKASTVALTAAMRFTIKAEAYTAQAGERVAADLSGGAWTLSLPEVPVGGDTVIVAIIGGDVTSNNLTISGNGTLINGEATISHDVPFATISLIFNGTEWRIA